MKIKAYSKINIGLDIDSTQYKFTTKHKIKSLFLLNKNYYDEIEIVKNKLNFHQIIYHYISIEEDKCLIRKTLNYLTTKKLINSYYSINIYKNIPIQAGLGGGSSDCAAVIKELVKDYNKLDMLDIALNLGSDVPFFLTNSDCAIVSGFGEIIEPVKLKTNLDIKIHLTNYKFSTKLVFDKFLEESQKYKVNDYYELINSLNSNKIIKSFHNVFLDTVFNLCSEWKNIYNNLLIKHDFIIMSGSGGTIVSIDKKRKTIRTRYAPSPTGYFHIGGARTAIFNYLFAKHNNGKFIVRIEDTDVNRTVDNGINSQLDNLEWLKIHIDESINNPGEFGPYIQTSKLNRYQELANRLLQENKAYYCFCNEEQLAKDRELNLQNHQTPKYNRRCLNLSQEEITSNLNNNIPKVIRLKIQDNTNYEWNDLIRGSISVPAEAMTDPVILKSNNIPMYNFAVVVDDYDMQISHVLRGEEHISNTPYQLAIKEALNFDNEILFGHLSVIIDETGKKLSKRNKEMKQFIEDYKVMGFLPEAIVNFLALLSWSHPDNKEILNIEELIKSFDLTRLSKSPTFFDYKKMLWIGNEYFKKMSNEEYIEFVKPFITIELNDFLKNNFNDLVLLFKNQISYASELNGLILNLLNNDLNLSQEAKDIIATHSDVIQTYKSELQTIETWNIETINNLINTIKVKTNKKGKDLFMPIRIVTSGSMHGPELAKVIFFKQRNIIIDNIDKINIID